MKRDRRSIYDGLRIDNMFKITFSILSFLFFTEATTAQTVETIQSVSSDRTLTGSVELHLTDATNPIRNNSTIDIKSNEAWLYFDNMKPSNVLTKYGGNILINGDPFEPNVNARLSIYIQGTVIAPYPHDIKPLTVYSEINFSGESAEYNVDFFYTNKRGSEVRSNMALPLGIEDNTIRSFKLKKGYMATLANNSDGTGYSRVFIADKEDIELSELPALLDQNISFIRVFRWEWVSKKGWAGGDPPVGMADFLNCTWYYTWGASNNSTDNLEFCPERWGLNWPGWREITNRTGVSHLLGLNEPDHVEQSNVAVPDAVNDWHKALQTGMRLGSPATTDFNWLYQFMDECEARNYRVDYVVVHAYWGGKSPQNWYKDLKAIAGRTGRPLWIKEWNNGANWTNESWPDDPSVLTDANAQKQLNDLKGILTVFDTSSFIERYSIYNWVEDARAMIIDGGGEANWQITPAGEYYRDNKSQIAYDIRNEVIPDWTINNSPVLNYKFLGEGSAIELDWYHEDWELINTFTLEIKEDDGPYNIIGIYENPVQSTFTEKVSVSASGNITFRVQSVGIDSSVQESNLIKFEVLGVENDFSIGHLSVPTNDWTLYLFDDNFSSVPIMIYGTPSFKNKTPLTQRVRNIGTNNFEFRLEQWDYLEMEPFTSPDSLAFLSLVPGNYNFGEISAEAGTVHGATRNWMQVDFTKTFDITPVVFVTLESDNGLPASARVRNVTSSGFELALQYEEGGNPGSSVENIAYLAITPGKGEINGERIIVSNTPASAVGEFFDSYRIEFGEEFDNPAFFGSMQTVNDNIASTLRYKTLTKTSVEVFKQREISETTNSVLPESVGWMVIDTEAIAPLYTNGDPVRDLRIYPNPTIDRLRFDGLNSPTQVSVYSMTGEEVLSSYVINYLDVRGLNKGVYLIKINDHKILRFIKE